MHSGIPIDTEFWRRKSTEIQYFNVIPSFFIFSLEFNLKEITIE